LEAISEGGKLWHWQLHHIKTRQRALGEGAGRHRLQGAFGIEAISATSWGSARVGPNVDIKGSSTTSNGPNMGIKEGSGFRASK